MPVVAKNRDFYFVEIASGIGGLKPGAEKSFAAIRSYCKSHYQIFYQRYLTEYASVELTNTTEQETAYAKHIKTVYVLGKNIVEVVTGVLDDDKVPVTISGDHSSAAALAAAITRYWPDKRLGVIWIDAHADINSPYTTISGNLHGMPVSAMLGLDHFDFAQNTWLPEESLRYWKCLQGLYNEHFVNVADLTYIAVRQVDPSEEKVLDKYADSILMTTVDEIRGLGVKKVVDRIARHLDKCDHWFVSFDVDCLDIEYGTGTPVAGGLSIDESTELLQELVKQPKLALLDIAELNPALDSDSRATQVVADLLAKLFD